MIFQVLLFEWSFTRFWRIVFSLLALHVASESFLNTLDCVQCVYTYAYQSPRTVQYSICVFPAAICIMCVGACLVMYRGSPQSLVLLLLTHVSFHMSQNMFKLYMHTQTHAPSQSLSNSYTHTQQLFALPLRKLYNNNSVCNNASNANPHRSKRRVSCGSSASHIKAVIEILASRQAAVFVYMCLSHTVMWNQMLPCEHPTGHKPTSAISRWILHY